jgi:hypothetical protein
MTLERKALQPSPGFWDLFLEKALHVGEHFTCIATGVCMH